MDPLCHTLVGTALAGSRLGDRTWGAAATLVVAANLPDVDVVAYAWGADTALLFRRGWTHGVLAIAVLPLVLAAIVVAIGRWRGASGLRPGQVVLLAYLGLLTHPALDWLNTYGMRWGMPFDGTWSYGDTLFIVDPWLWLLLGGASFLRFSGSRRAIAAWAAIALVASLPVLATPFVPAPARVGWVLGLTGFAALRAWGGPPTQRSGHRLATAALILAAGYVALLLAATSLAERGVRHALLAAGDPTPGEVYAGPVPADPARRDILLIGPDDYRPVPWRFGYGLGEAADPIPVGDEDPRVAAALQAPCARGMRAWSRYPFFVVEEEAPGGVVVHFLDARYVRGVTRGFGATAIRLGPDGSVVGCD